MSAIGRDLDRSAIGCDLDRSAIGRDLDRSAIVTVDQCATYRSP